jgi:hypothetical protein
MKSFGGGWLMCYTTVGGVHVSRETSPIRADAAYGSDGYRADCRNYPFNQVGALFLWITLNIEKTQRSWTMAYDTMMMCKAAWYADGHNRCHQVMYVQHSSPVQQEVVTAGVRSTRVVHVDEDKARAHVPTCAAHGDAHHRAALTEPSLPGTS